MLNLTESLTIINFLFFLLVAILCALYVLGIIVNRRFYSSVNILTGNFCVCGALTATFWMIYVYFETFKDWTTFRFGNKCIFSLTCSTVLSGLLVNSLLIISINRYVIITYPNKHVFKRISSSFLFCIGQWTLTFLLCIPHLVNSIEVSAS